MEENKSNKHSSKRNIIIEDDYLEKYKRVLADYQNLQRRTEEEKSRIIRMANERLVSSLIEVLDDIEESQKHINDEGLEKVINKFKSILELESVMEINPQINKDSFNPDMHEALESVKGSKGTIIKVFRKGYKISDKVIRPALVAVGNGTEKSKL